MLVLLLLLLRVLGVGGVVVVVVVVGDGGGILTGRGCLRGVLIFNGLFRYSLALLSPCLANALGR